MTVSFPRPPARASRLSFGPERSILLR
jgi:hypothetical protein